jgi:hypothetical protein
MNTHLKVTPEKLLAIGFEPMSPLKAIRRKCIECSGENPKEVAECCSTTCLLWPFRFGKNPWKKPLSDARREELRERGTELARSHGFSSR